MRSLGFELEVGVHVPVPERVSAVTFPAPEVFGVQLHNAICKHVKLITDLIDGLLPHIMEPMHPAPEG